MGETGGSSDQATGTYVFAYMVAAMWLIKFTGRSKNAGQAAVEQVIQVRNKSDQLFTRLTNLEEALQNPMSTPQVRLYAELNVEDTRKAWKTEKDRAARLERQLGINDTTVLRKLAFAEYYSALMNARALKERLLAKLVDRKFELDPIERSVRRTTSGTSFESEDCHATHLWVQKINGTSTLAQQSSGASPTSTIWCRRTTSYANE